MMQRTKRRLLYQLSSAIYVTPGRR